MEIHPKPERIVIGRSSNPALNAPNEKLFSIGWKLETTLGECEKSGKVYLTVGNEEGKKRCFFRGR